MLLSARMPILFMHMPLSLGILVCCCRRYQRTIVSCLVVIDRYSSGATSNAGLNIVIKVGGDPNSRFGKIRDSECMCVTISTFGACWLAACSQAGQANNGGQSVGRRRAATKRDGWMILAFGFFCLFFASFLVHT